MYMSVCSFSSDHCFCNFYYFVYFHLNFFLPKGDFLGLFNRVSLLLAGFALRVIALLTFIWPLRLALVAFSPTLFFTFIGALQAAGLALTCPLRAPCRQRNFRVCLPPERLHTLADPASLTDSKFSNSILIC